MAKTEYVWDELSDNVIEEYEGGVLSVSYTHEPGLYGNLLSENRNGVTSYYHFDGRGDTVALTDDAGNVTDTNAYDAWGNVIESTGIAVTPYLFIGRLGYQTDANTGRLYVRARMYSQTVARWMSFDPIFNLAMRSPFEYCENSPMQLTDPTGLCKVSIYDGDDKGSPRPDVANGNHFRCAAINLADPGYAIDISGNPGWGAAVSNKLKGCGCISQLSIVDHGCCGSQHCGVGRGNGFNGKDVMEICDSMCENSSVQLFGCDVFSNGTPYQESQKQKVLDRFLKLCPKIKKVSGCTGAVAYPDEWDVPETHCDACKRDPNRRPSCKGVWKSFPETTGKPPNPPPGFPWNEPKL